MKTREQINKLRKTHDLITRRLLAAGAFPGTKFDDVLFNLPTAALFWKRTKGDICKDHTHSALPKWCQGVLIDFALLAADAIRVGNSGFLREIADAIDAFSNHRPEPDQLRQALIEIIWQPSFNDQVLALLRERGLWQPAKMRDVLARLNQRGFLVSDSQIRHVRRLCAELGFKVEGKPGRPKNRTRSRKK